MILNELKEQLSDYEVKKITKENINDVFELMRSNTYFYSRTQKHHVTMQECLDDITALPPNIEIDKKTYVAIYDNDKCIAVIDLIEGFPEQDIMYLGLFMLDACVHKKGLGKKLLSGIIEVSKKKFNLIELACYETNEIGFAFWSKMGFKVIRKTERETDGEIYILLSMQKTLK